MDRRQCDAGKACIRRTWRSAVSTPERAERPERRVQEPEAPGEEKSEDTNKWNLVIDGKLVFVWKIDGN